MKPNPYTADYLVGRRFRLTTVGIPEFTCVAYDAAKGIRVHAADGGRWWLQLDYFRSALKCGLMEESEGPPFVWEEEFPTAAELAAIGYTPVPKSTVAQLRRRLRAFLDKNRHAAKSLNKKFRQTAKG